MTCQVLLRHKNDLIRQGVDLYWVIDHELIGLAKALLGPELTVHWIGIRAKDLLNASFIKKILSFFGLWLKLLALRPNQIALLHRDQRYKLLGLLTLATNGRIAQVKTQIHEVDRIAETLNALGYKQEPPAGAPTPLETDAMTVGLLLGGGSNLKVTYNEKKWPHFEALANLLLKNDQVHLVLLGTQDEKSLSDAIVASNPAGRIKNLVGQLKLNQLPHTLSKLQALVTVDTGLSHIAATVMQNDNQGLFVLFGPTNFAVWGAKPLYGAMVKTLTLNLECSPCYKDDGQYLPCSQIAEKKYSCMKNITPEHVSKEVLLFMLR